MARPRLPSNVLELKGAFKHNPQRKREDLDGVGKFDQSPPRHLRQDLVPMWREIVGQINPIVLTASDAVSIEVMCNLLAQFRVTGHQAYATELRQWFGQYGMTAASRAKIGAPKQKPGGNKFQDV